MVHDWIREVTYVVNRQQYKDDLEVVRRGKVVWAVLGNVAIGGTGFVEWNRDEYLKDNLNTARLKYVQHNFAIHVDENRRHRGIGENLLEIIVGEAAKSKFEQLIIYGVLASKKGFYDKALGRIVDAKKILSLDCERDGRVRQSDYVYRLMLPEKSRK